MWTGSHLLPPRGRLRAAAHLHVLQSLDAPPSPALSPTQRIQEKRPQYEKMPGPTFHKILKKFIHWPSRFVEQGL